MQGAVPGGAIPPGPPVPAAALRESPLAQRRRRCCRPGDRHAIGRGRDIIEPGLLAKGDAGRIAAMLAADAELDVGPRRAAPLGG
ncbi:hypothetical protein QU38_02765, partial [Staphylococcus aureus]